MGITKEQQEGSSPNISKQACNRKVLPKFPLLRIRGERGVIKERALIVRENLSKN
jgi:hypothetical protein